MSVRLPRPTHRRRVFAASLLVLAAALVTACGASSDEGNAASASEAEIAPGSDRQSPAGASPTLPADFPAGIALPAGPHLISSISTDEDVTTLVLEGTFDLDHELVHLMASAEQAGYTVDQHTRAESGSIDQLYLELSDEAHTVSIAIINRPESGVATYEVTPAP